MTEDHGGCDGVVRDHGVVYRVVRGSESNGSSFSQIWVNSIPCPCVCKPPVFGSVLLIKECAQKRMKGISNVPPTQQPHSTDE